MTAGRRSALCTTRVTSGRRDESFHVVPCRGVSRELAQESRETVDGRTYSSRLSRRTSALARIDPRLLVRIGPPRRQPAWDRRLILRRFVGEGLDRRRLRPIFVSSRVSSRAGGTHPFGARQRRKEATRPQLVSCRGGRAETTPRSAASRMGCPLPTDATVRRCARLGLVSAWLVRSAPRRRPQAPSTPVVTPSSCFQQTQSRSTMSRSARRPNGRAPGGAEDDASHPPRESRNAPGPPSTSTGGSFLTSGEARRSRVRESRPPRQIFL
jgi:hypothetical protein